MNKNLLIVCFVTWGIATEILLVDLMKFNARAELLEQAARMLNQPRFQQNTLENL